MKSKKHYIAYLLGITLLFNACEKIEPEFFDEEYNGAYFDYQYAADFETTLNFGEYVIGNPDNVPLTLNIKLLGYLTDEARSLSIKTKEVEGYELANITVPEVVFKDREYQKNIEVIVKRPEQEDLTYAICLYLDGEGDLGTGIAGKNEFTIYVKEVHEKPNVWWGQIQTYIGDWDREKHAFLANLMNNDYYYNALYNTEQGQHKYNEIIALNELAVSTLLAEEPETPIAINFPILKETEYAEYEKPYFWDKYQEYLGLYRSEKFCRFAHLINAANTADIIAGYETENALEMMEKYKVTYHKEDVLAMLNAYYNYAISGYTIDKYKELFWVEIQNNTDYVTKGVYLKCPYWWEDPDNLGTAEIVKRYFGEYDDKKYQFMLKTIMAEDGNENFVAATILPFARDIQTNSYIWDETAGGEERIKECYRLIKAKNDKRPANLRFEIPEVELD